jgi:hypothetical protein
MSIRMSRPARRAARACAFAALLAGLAIGLGACGGSEAGRSGGEPPPGAARLAVRGAELHDPSGGAVWLRGFNWGWWGTAQPEDGQENAARGANLVRIPFRWYFSGEGADIRQSDAPGHLSPQGLAALDDMVRQATDAGLWVVLFAGSDLGAGDADRNFWTDDALRQEFIETWAFLVQRYHQTPRIAAYELLSEPHPKRPASSADLRRFYEELIAVVRLHDADTPLVIGANDHYDIGQLEDVLSTADDKLVYAANFYLPTEYCKPDRRGPQNPEPVRYPGSYLDADGHPQTVDAQALAAALKPAEDFRTRHAVPVFIDQVGCVGAAPDVLAYTRDVLALLRARQFPWAFWTYRTNETGPDQHGLWYRPRSGWALKTDLDAVLREAMAP